MASITGGRRSAENSNSTMGSDHLFFYSDVRKPIQEIRNVFLVSAHPVNQMHWLPATWPPVRYQNWTSTSKQTMTFQNTPRCC
jgi:hypothetical protein